MISRSEYILLRGWRQAFGAPGLWVDPHGVGQYTEASAEQLQLERDAKLEHYVEHRLDALRRSKARRENDV